MFNWENSEDSRWRYNLLNSELLYAGHANILASYCITSEFSDEIWAQEFGC